jgi:hypothetical protein
MEVTIMPYSHVAGHIPYFVIVGAVVKVVIIGGLFYFTYQINKSLKRIANSLDKTKE